MPVKAWPNTAVEGEPQGLVTILRFLQVESQVTTSVNIDVQSRVVDNHKSLDRCVSHTAVRIPGNHDPGIEIRTTVFQCMNGNRHSRQVQGVWVAFIDRAVFDDDRRNRLPLPVLDTAGYKAW